jgi:hypothetical protein
MNMIMHSAPEPGGPVAARAALSSNALENASSMLMPFCSFRRAALVTALSLELRGRMEALGPPRPTC